MFVLVSVQACGVLYSPIYYVRGGSEEVNRSPLIRTIVLAWNQGIYNNPCHEQSETRNNLNVRAYRRDRDCISKPVVGSLE